jgi:hypothetical protein
VSDVERAVLEKLAVQFKLEESAVERALSEVTKALAE